MPGKLIERAEAVLAEFRAMPDHLKHRLASDGITDESLVVLVRKMAMLAEEAPTAEIPRGSTPAPRPADSGSATPRARP
jgi:hypothetical protein